MHIPTWLAVNDEIFDDCHDGVWYCEEKIQTMYGRNNAPNLYKMCGS